MADETTKGRVDNFSEIGSTGLRQYSGYIFEDFVKKLQGRKGGETYQEMSDNDNTIGGMLFAIENLIRGVKWNITPGGETPKDKEIAEFVESCLDDMDKSFEETVASILSFFVFGFSYHELVYKKRNGRPKKNRRSSKGSKHTDGKIGWAKWPIRSQLSILNARWKFDENGELKGAFQIAPPNHNQVFIPIEKALLFRADTKKENPEGRSMLRNAYVSWWYKTKIQKIEAIGVERDLVGLPVMKVPLEIMLDTAPPELKAIYAEVKTIVQNIRRDEQEGIVMPSSFDKESGNELYSLGLLKGEGKRQFDTDKIITRYSLQILFTVLADFLMLGHTDSGSRSLSENKTNLFTSAISSLLRSVAEPINQWAIPELLRLNGWEGMEPPKLEHAEVRDVDIEKFTNAIAKLTTAGMPLFPDEDAEAEVRKIVGIPAKSEDFEAQQEEKEEKEMGKAEKMADIAAKNNPKQPFKGK